MGGAAQPHRSRPSVDRREGREQWQSQGAQRGVINVADPGGVGDGCWPGYGPVSQRAPEESEQVLE